jgi:hypothetical protein
MSRRGLDWLHVWLEHASGNPLPKVRLSCAVDGPLKMNLDDGVELGSAVAIEVLFFVSKCLLWILLSPFILIGKLLGIQPEKP